MNVAFLWLENIKGNILETCPRGNEYSQKLRRGESLNTYVRVWGANSSNSGEPSSQPNPTKIAQPNVVNLNFKRN